MKKLNLMMLAGGVAAVVFALHANAQSSDAAAAPATAAAPSAKVANRALAKKVRRALAKTKGLDPTHIYVKAAGGTVTLTGSCDTQQQSDLAAQAAQGVDGVSSVANKLSIRSPN